jgi:hypothetical protein
MNRLRFWGWIFVATITYTLLAFGACLIAVMPPINIVMIPPWIAIMMGAVGSLSNRIGEARSALLAERAGRLARPAHERFVEGALVAEAE